MFQKKEGEDGIIKTGIEKHAYADQTPEVGFGSSRGFRMIHRSDRMMSF
jgi:hypothetical protein